jgi:hypothetical protein
MWDPMLKYVLEIRGRPPNDVVIFCTQVLSWLEPGRLLCDAAMLAY